jgi:hypothetical protein
MKMKRMGGARAWATSLCTVFAFVSACAAETYKADALLSVDMNRAAVVEKVSAAWSKEIPAAQTAAFKAKLLGLRADQLLATSLSGTFDGVLEVMAQSPGASTLPAIGSAQTYYASRAELTVGENKDQAKATGETARDFVYTPLVPCRLFDTRAGQGSALGTVGGTFSNQQTKLIVPAGACGIPTTGVVSLFLSFHSFNNNPATLGVIGFMKPGAPFSALAATWTGAPWATGTYITQTNPNGSFDAFIGNGQTMTADLIVDVMGYFQAPDRNGDGLRVLYAGTDTPTVINGNDNNISTSQGATISGGTTNFVSGDFGSIGGGNANTAGLFAFVGGGAGNTSEGTSATIAGGSSNTVSGVASSIVGGRGGKLLGINSFIGSGGAGTTSTCYNHILTTSPVSCWNEIAAAANSAVIVGGYNNRNTNFATFLGGGASNTIAQNDSAIVGGVFNTVNGQGYGAFIGAGNRNTTGGTASVIVGGGSNTIGDAAGAAFIGGGTSNVANGNKAFIGGGDGNLASGDRAVIVGGGTNYVPAAGATNGCFNFVNPNPVLDGTCVNRAQGRRNFIGAGTGNETNNNESVAVGGLSNRATGLGSIVVGGIANTASGDRAIVVGGGSTSVNTCFNRASGLNDGPCQNVASALRSTVVGGAGNNASGSDAFIGAGFSNQAAGPAAVVGGGAANYASGERSAIAGGGSTGNNCYNRATQLSDGPCQNVASGSTSFVGSGFNNVASGVGATISGGSSNLASGEKATIAGGNISAATGAFAAVPGGRSNWAAGAFSFAGGRGAWSTSATSTFDTAGTNYFGTFIWADSPNDFSGATPAPAQIFRATADNQFAVRARGGVYFKTDPLAVAANATDATPGCALLPGGSASWSCSSDRNLKDGIKAISPKDVLLKVVNLPLSTWQFKGTSRRHLSPMAQDFWAAFGFGEDDRHITASDVSGVALAAVQGVNQKMNDELAQLKAKNAQLQRSNEAMLRELAAIKKKLGF